MFRNIQHLSSEDFLLKRQVFEQDVPTPVPFPVTTFEPPPDAPKSEEVMRGTRRALGYVRQEVQDAVTRALDADPDKLRDMYAKVAGDGAEVDWKKTNNTLNDALHLEGTQRATATEKVRALQRVVFTALGVLDKDPQAIVDGRLGPYTLAALARYARVENPPPVPHAYRNKALNAHKTTEAESKTPPPAPPGAAFLQGAIRQRDGSYLLNQDGARTYLKFESGLWWWAADTNQGPWTPVLKQAEPANPTNKVNVILDRLTPEALQAERKKLEDFVKAAKEQPKTGDASNDAYNAAAIEDAEKALAALKAPPAKTIKSTPEDEMKDLKGRKANLEEWLRENELTGNPETIKQAEKELAAIDSQLAAAAKSTAPSAPAPSPTSINMSIPREKSPEEKAYETALANYNRALADYEEAQKKYTAAENAYRANNREANFVAVNAAGAAETKAKKIFEAAQAALRDAYEPFKQGPPAAS